MDTSIKVFREIFKDYFNSINEYIFLAFSYCSLVFIVVSSFKIKTELSSSFFSFYIQGFLKVDKKFF